jgi:signal transduction histidine kinase
MKVMGLQESGYWVCWLIYYFATSTVIAGICTILLSWKVLPLTSGGLLFLFIWLFGLSHFGYILLMHSLFTSPRTASILATLAFFLTSFLDRLVSSTTPLPEWQRTLASLLPTISMSRGLQNILTFEKGLSGLQTGNLATVYYGHRVSTSMWMYVVSMLVMALIGAVIMRIRTKI